VATHPEYPPDWIDNAPVTVERSVEIEATREQVWAYIADHEAWPDWFGAISKVEVTGEPSGVGGARRVTIGKAPPVDEIFTAWDENERFAFAIVGSKLPFLGALAESVEIDAIEVASGETGSRVTYRQGIELKRGFGWLAARASNRLGGQLSKALEQLRIQVESTSTSPD
jgi:uncharacterized protein YndB with AHSA1/START domain